MKRVVNLKALYFGTPVVLVSSRNLDASTNLAPMSSAWWLDRTAVLGMSVSSQTVRNLMERPECVLNLADASMVGAVDRIALMTGRPDIPERKRQRGYTYEPDKFAAAGLTPVDSDLVAVQGVHESPIRMEGVVEAIRPIADGNLRTLEIRIHRTHVDADLVMPLKDHYIDPVKWDPLIMKFTEFFAGGRLIHPSALARGWEMPLLNEELAQNGR
ncbi:flavin reductase family protein [Kribbella deserti]|uniref:Flavin reductase family protein n=1 Tax=Kribbella deserti TaxID=1926257 RepID=A0ABV6QV59_9ACTN